MGEYYSMDKYMQRDTIRMALAAAQSIPADKLATLVKTWLEVLADFEPAKRDAMFRAYCKEIKDNPSSMRGLDLNLLTDSYLSLPQIKRNIIADSLHEVLLSIPEPQKILQLAPTYSLEALGLK